MMRSTARRKMSVEISKPVRSLNSVNVTKTRMLFGLRYRMTTVCSLCPLLSYVIYLIAQNRLKVVLNAISDEKGGESVCVPQ